MRHKAATKVQHNHAREATGNVQTEDKSAVLSQHQVCARINGNCIYITKTMVNPI